MRLISFVRAAAGAGALALLLTACGGGNGGPAAIPSSATPGFSTASIPPQLQIKDWGESTLRSATYLGPVSNVQLSVSVLVHQQNAAALLQYASDVNDPSSANFRKWLTPAQLAERFGASKADYQAAATYFAQQGLHVGAWPQRMMLTVSGRQSELERAFNTRFGLYRRDGETFVAPVTTPHFAHAVPVDAVGHLVAFRPQHTYILNAPRAGAGQNLGYSPQQIRAAFDFNGAYGAGYNGAGVTLAIIATGPIDSYAGGSGDRDLDALRAMYNSFASAHVTQVDVTASGVAAGLAASGIPTAPPTGVPPSNGFPYSNAFASPPPVTASCSGSLPACNPEDGEAQLDVQQAASLAPGASVHFVLAYNADDCSTATFPNQCAPGTGSPALGLNEADAEIQQTIADNTADVVSMSYGGGESQMFSSYAQFQTSYYALEFAELSAEGVAAFASSGDSGSAECYNGTGTAYLPQVCVSYPAGDPHVTSVGGVTAYFDSLGVPDAPILAWGISTGDSGYGVDPGNMSGSGASGGGTSTFMPAPSWQRTSINATMREQPDVAMIGDLNTGVTTYENSSFPTSSSYGPGPVGGTSVAAPQMAAMWALVLSACRQHPGAGLCPASPPYRLGNASPYFYSIYRNTASLGYTGVFYDVLYGSNEMASNAGLPSAPVPGAVAMPGYDEVTGVGVPYAGHLVQAVTGLAVP